MEIEEIKQKTNQIIDDVKTTCANFGLGNSSGEYKIITEVFLYKFLNDKFLYSLKQVSPKLKEAGNKAEEVLSKMNEQDYEKLLFIVDDGKNAILKLDQTISALFSKQNEKDFHKTFDKTLTDIAEANASIFSVSAGSGEKIYLFEGITKYIVEENKKTPFCKSIINTLAKFSFEEVFAQKYDFFASIFEYLIKDYNKDFGKYAEYYTPHSIATIIANVLAPKGAKNVEIYDPAAGSGTLLLALAHKIGESNCTVYSQDISQKSNEFLRLNLILNNMVDSLCNVVHDDTLMNPRHLNKTKNGLKQFDYIVSNPPFKMDFSDNRDKLAVEENASRFFAGIPIVPPKEKDGMAIYLMFLQHIIYSLKENGKAAVVVPTGFITSKKNIEQNIIKKLVDNKWLKGVISMPSNIFATTGTNVSILFIDKSNSNGNVILLDASKLGTKVKEDGKNQKTVLSPEEIKQIEQTFIDGKVIDDFSVSVTYDQIKEKGYVLSAGQYFDIKIEYVDITEEEFNAQMKADTEELKSMFAESHKLEKEIEKQLGSLKFSE